MTELKSRYEFVMLFDCENGNPNGDPDAGNMPRVDAETGHGIVTDVCIKRKIRNFVEAYMAGEAGYGIIIKNDKALNSKFDDAYDACGLEKGKNGQKKEDVETAKGYICANYYDVRTFGAVMSTGDNPCGIVRGPVQINFARSIDVVNPQEITITRQAVTKAGDDKANEMGKKSFIHYGLYRAEGYVSALLANKTGFGMEDLELLWLAIINMFEHDHSAARGKMSLKKLIVFKHDSVLGNAPSSVLFDKVTVSKKADVDTPRYFSDYEVVIDTHTPEGVTVIEKL